MFISTPHIPLGPSTRLTGTTIEASIQSDLPNIIHSDPNLSEKLATPGTYLIRNSKTAADTLTVSVNPDPNYGSEFQHTRLYNVNSQDVEAEAKEFAKKYGAKELVLPASSA